MNRQQLDTILTLAQSAGNIQTDGPTEAIAASVDNAQGKLRAICDIVEAEIKRRESFEHPIAKRIEKIVSMLEGCHLPENPDALRSTVGEAWVQLHYCRMEVDQLEGDCYHESRLGDIIQQRMNEWDRLRQYRREVTENADAPLPF